MYWRILENYPPSEPPAAPIFYKCVVDCQDTYMFMDPSRTSALSPVKCLHFLKVSNPSKSPEVRHFPAADSHRPFDLLRLRLGIRVLGFLGQATVEITIGILGSLRSF